ncbi:MAG: CehA/McbA family metallohydrolase [Planctomycetota bacterium]|nr:MAG: CehA/McbA family metallohydrolase [Planctomycetota bacterium]
MLMFKTHISGLIKFFIVILITSVCYAESAKAGNKSGNRRGEIDNSVGRLTIRPADIPAAGTTVPTVFEITIGKDGLNDGGKIELRWSAWRPAVAFDFKDFQITCDEPTAVFDLVVSPKKNWRWSSEPLICEAAMKRGGLLELGTKVIFTTLLTYSKHSNVVSEIKAYVAPRVDAKPQPIADRIVLRSHAGSAANIRCIAEARPVADQPGRVVVAVVDAYENPAEDFRGTVRLACSAKTDLAREYTFTGQDAGSPQFHVRFPKDVVSRIEVTCGNMSAVSNPILPRRSEEPGIYFGDIHSHCDISSDGVGSADHAYEYARRFYGLDLAALTDHSPRGAKWQKEIEVANRHNVDGQFVTFLGFEWSDSVRGHRNIYYREDTGSQQPKRIRNNTEPLWKYFDQDNIRALTVPHHSNTQSVKKRPDGRPVWGPADFSAVNHKYQRIVEICQNRGSFEVPGGPIPELRVVAKDLGSSVQTALVKGHRFGFIGSTDTHSGRPGTGIARCAIISSDFSRRGLWDAMYHRSCYATSGKHILVFFTLNDKPMGSELAFSDPGVKRRIRWRVVGTSTLKRVDLLRNNKVVKSWPGRGKDDMSESFVFNEPLENTEWWYLRTIQQDTEMAWSSPIWIDVAK